MLMFSSKTLKFQKLTAPIYHRYSHFASNPKSNPPRNSSSLVIWKCKSCSGTHNKGNCPAYYRNCLKCNRKGQYSSCCNNFSRVHQVKKHAESSTSDSDGEFFIAAIYNENKNNAIVAFKKNAFDWSKQ